MERFRNSEGCAEVGTQEFGSGIGLQHKESILIEEEEDGGVSSREFG